MVNEWFVNLCPFLKIEISTSVLAENGFVEARMGTVD
jgi:hypothetical protein